MSRDILLATLTDVVTWGFLFLLLGCVWVIWSVLIVSARAERRADAAWRLKALEDDQKLREALDRWSR